MPDLLSSLVVTKAGKPGTVGHRARCIAFGLLLASRPRLGATSQWTTSLAI
jgi:hypothetical protein